MDFSTVLLTLLVPLGWGVAAWFGSRPFAGREGFFSKEYTGVLKGLCCLLVVYVHVPSSYGNAVQKGIGSFAYVAVTLFFLFSAYGMMYGLERKAGYLDHFWRNRLPVLLVPCVLANLLSFGLGIAGGEGYRWARLWELNPYVSVLLQWCVWFYVVEWSRQRWFAENKSLADGLLIAGVALSSVICHLAGERMWTGLVGWSVPRMGLIWGVLLYRHFGKIVEWMGRGRGWKLAMFLAAVVAFGGAYLQFKTLHFTGGYLLRILLGAALTALLFTASFDWKLGGKVCLWLGSVSYEVYLIHGAVMRWLGGWISPGMGSGIFMVVTLAVCLGASAILHAIAKPLVWRLRV